MFYPEDKTESYAVHDVEAQEDVEVTPHIVTIRSTVTQTTKASTNRMESIWYVPGNTKLKVTDSSLDIDGTIGVRKFPGSLVMINF